MTDETIIGAPAMETDVEEVSRWRRRVQVRVPAALAESAREEHVRELAKRVDIKGFRPGKAPPRIVEKQFGERIDRSVLQDLVQEGFQSAMASEGLEPVSTPEFDQVRWNPDGSLQFVAEFDVKPEIELERTTNFQVERKIRRISDADVDRVLERLREERADWEPVDRPAAEGDAIVFDSVPLDENDEPREAERVENHRVEIGSESLIPDFEEGLRGLKADAVETLDVRFPDDHPTEALRGVERRFRVSVDRVLERNLPDLDDAFARSVGEFDSVEALREHVRGNLEQEVEEQSRREVDEALIDEIIEANDIELPESMVERYLTNMLADESGPVGRVPEERQDEVREVLRPGAERAMRRYTILRRVARDEGLEATDADVEDALAERADASDRSVAELRVALERSGELEDFRFHLTMERVFAWLREHSNIRPVEVDPDQA